MNKGQVPSEQKKTVFEPNDTEMGLISRFGGLDRTGFRDFQDVIVGAGIAENRRALVSNAIVESRRQSGLGSQERR